MKFGGNRSGVDKNETKMCDRTSEFEDIANYCMVSIAAQISFKGHQRTGKRTYRCWG